MSACPDAHSQKAAVEAILRAVPPEEDEWLIGVIGKQIPIAARMLAAMDTIQDTSLLKEVSHAYAAWVVHGPVDPCIETLRDFPSGDVRAQIGRDLVRLLLDSDEDSEDEQRARPVIALLQLAPLELLEETLELLSHEDPFIRGHAALIHGYLHNQTATSRLMELLEKDEDEIVPAYAAKALGKMRHEPALALMVSRIRDPDSDEALGVVDGLLEYGGVEAIDPLFAAIEKDSMILLGLEMGTGSAPDLSAARTDKRVLKLKKGLKSRSEDRREESVSMLRALRAAEAEDDLIAALSDKSSLVRSSACTALADIEATRAVPRLIELLEDRDGPVRYVAAEALGRLKAIEALGPLVKLLARKPRSAETDDHDRVEAARALGALGSSEAIEPLIEALLDGQTGVRASAAEALGMLQAAEAHRPLLVTLHDREAVVASAAARALAKLGRRDAAPMIAKLRNPGRDSEKLQAAVFESLWFLSSEPRPVAPKVESDSAFDGLLDRPLSEAVQVGAERIASAARLEELVHYSRPGQRAWLTETLGKQVPLAACIAASYENLASDAVSGLADRLTAWIAERSSGLSREVLPAIPPGAFRELLGEKLARALSNAAADSIPALGAAVVAVNTESVWAVLASAKKPHIYLSLLELDPSRPETLRAVLRLVQSRRGATRLDGVRALAQLSGERVDAALKSCLKDASRKVRALAGMLLAARGEPRGLRFLRPHLKSTEGSYERPEVLFDKVPASAALVDRLVSLIDDKDWTVRVQAVRGLGALKATAAVPALVERLLDTEWEHDGDAIESLGAIGDERAVPALLTFVCSEYSHERKSAVRALAAIGDTSVVPTFLTAMDDAEEDVSETAILALGLLGATDASDRILGCLARDAPEVRAAAAQALGELRIGRAVEPLIERLSDDSDSDVRAAAARALGLLADGRATEVLCRATTDEAFEVAGAAIEALGKLGDPLATTALIAALDSHHCAAAAKSLAMTGDERAASALSARARGYSRAPTEAMEALWALSERLTRPK